MAGSTQFPAALDAFPDIGPNTGEDAAGVEHDVVHANVHAAVAALQAKVGADASADTASLDARVAGNAGRIDDHAGLIAAHADRIDATEAGIDALVDEQAAQDAAHAAHVADPVAHASPADTVVVVAGVATLDCSAHRFFSLALDINATLAITNAPAADCLILRVVPSAGSQLTLPGNATLLDGSTYAGGTAPHVLGFMTMDAGATFDVVVQQP